MNVALVALILFVMVVNGEQKCYREEDCNDDECCLYRPFSLFRGGTCEKLANEGEDCSEEDDFKIFGKFYKHCPCQDGLSCVPSDVKNMGIFGKIKLDEKCTVHFRNGTATPEIERETETDAPVEED